MNKTFLNISLKSLLIWIRTSPFSFDTTIFLFAKPVNSIKCFLIVCYSNNLLLLMIWYWLPLLYMNSACEFLLIDSILNTTLASPNLFLLFNWLLYFWTCFSILQSGWRYPLYLQYVHCLLLKLLRFPALLFVLFVYLFCCCCFFYRKQFWCLYPYLLHCV